MTEKASPPQGPEGGQGGQGPQGGRVRRLAWRIGLGVGIACLAFVAILVVRTLRFTSRQLQVAPAPALVLDEQAVVGRLSRALRFRTVSHADPAKIDPTPFNALIAYLERAFPGVHRVLKKERIGAHSLLFTWPGQDPARAPVLWLSHLDVVPVEAQGTSAWTYPPFSGTVAKGYLWGRGALDDKGQVLAMLEALEHLIGKGFTPRRTLLLAIGHDEEVGGRHGAARMAAALERRGVKGLYAMDEGLVITRNIVPGVTSPVALIGIAEKGFLNLELTVKGEGGHAAMPPPETAVSILANAVARLAAHPMAASLSGPVRQMFEAVGPEMSSFGKRLVLANLWLFGGLVKKQLAARSATNALLRTTAAPTMLQGSVKANVLPQQARAVINVRIHPQDSVAAVLRHARLVIADPRVRLGTGAEPPSEPSPPSSTTAAGYRLIAKAIRQVFPGTVVAPGLMIAMTDSRHYRKITPNIYRFAPLQIASADRARFHGVNERLSVKNYLKMIAFYVQLLEGSQ